ncbi:MAG: sensor histidine kinase [Zoogloeaceae bacterium]|nr:sensor histidine kinase [Zoogloeaceae bacterium]
MSSASAHRSLRLRLLAGTLFWIATSLVVAGWALSGMFHRHVETQFQAELKMHLDQLTAQLRVDEQGRVSLSQPLSDPRFNRPYSGSYWQLDAVGKAPGVLLRSRSLWDHALSVPQDAPADGEVHLHRIAGPENTMLGMAERVVGIGEAAGDGQRRFRLIAAADERLMIEPAARFSGALWLALAVLGVGLIVAALVQVFVGLAPLQRLRMGLARVRSGEAAQLEGRFPSEIMPLVDEFNSVLTQNAEVVGRARTQAGNLAHALKTPLSVLANAAGASEGDLARLVAEQVDVARRQVDYHLSRAQAAANVRLPGARTLVAPVVEGLLRAMQRIHAGRQLTISAPSLPPALIFRGETQDLQEMLGNLLDNACKWAGQRVELNLCSEAGQIVVTVDDDGAGLNDTRREEVMHRGVRADENVPGSGLGLSIVADLARMYGGSMQLQDSPLGGLRARLALPAAGGDA